MGLVHEVHEPGSVETRAYQLAAVLASRARVSQVGAKALLARVGRGERAEDAAVHALYERSLTGPEYAEGVAAFLAKRAPDFRGVR
jgi:enoyl-CoA hydratase/carnithine racemase